MKHTYTEEEKEKIAQLVFDWLRDYKVRDGEQACQDDEVSIYAYELICDLADIKNVTEE